MCKLESPEFILKYGKLLNKTIIPNSLPCTRLKLLYNYVTTHLLTILYNYKTHNPYFDKQ